ncbi:putative DNA repair and transcription factor Ada [Aspergillus stella-maris]|uniref:putative DNA repair and transcription factor Ada n=1 Tax=Aspergillus stella-maris TaxID=1810926 RepID=UPI003CCCF837
MTPTPAPTPQQPGRHITNPPVPIPTPKSSAPSQSTALRWQAVVTRDPSARFIYAVLTTKIYCRPSCAARLARRANIEFYDTPAQAERAGFRACKRCKPETLKPLVNLQVLVVQRAVGTIKKDIEMGRRPTLGRLAGEAGLTASHFHRVFKKVMGVTPGVYMAGALREYNNRSLGGEVEVEVQTDKGSGVMFEYSTSDLSLNENPSLDGVHDWSSGNLQFQPKDLEPYTDFDAWLAKENEVNWDSGSGPGPVGADIDVNNIDDNLLWNDFDALIAAEAELASGQGPKLDPLTGAPGLVFGSDSPGSGVSDDSSLLFVGV